MAAICKATVNFPVTKEGFPNFLWGHCPCTPNSANAIDIVWMRPGFYEKPACLCGIEYLKIH